MKRKQTAIIGVDEAGRGPLAGPVVAAAIYLPLECLEVWQNEEKSTLSWLTDSKKVTEKRREHLFEELVLRAVAYGISFVDARTIDHLNISNATHLAWKEAIEKCLEQIEDETSVRILIDGRERVPDLAYSQTPLVNGDAREVSIAAASILAKVSRDRYMREQAQIFPEYAFESHKGYGTRAHRQAIQTYGLSSLHRKSFCKKIR